MKRRRPIGALDEVFGEQPDRPDHADFWMLCSIALMLDGAAEAGEDVLRDRVAKLVDLRSLEYVAMQRAMRAFRVQAMERSDPRVRKVGGALIEGFAYGHFFAQNRAKAKEA